MKVEDKKKLCNKIFSRIFLFFLIAFLAIYLSNKTGYYDFKVHTKNVLTEEKIKEFEQDIKSGKNIDIKSYVIKESANYSNNVSRFGVKVSNTIEDIVVTGMNTAFNFINKAITG